MTIKKKLLGILVGSAVALSSLCPAFAADEATQPTTPVSKASKLEAKAKEKGITVEQFKAEVKKKKAQRAEKKEAAKAKLEAKAKEKGISVDELKAKIKERKENLKNKAEKKAKFKAKLEEKAKEKGMTVDELKAKFKEKKDKSDK